MTMSHWALLTLTGSSAVTDLLFGRIYNCIVVPAAVAGLVFAGLPSCGGSGPLLTERIADMVLVAMIFLPFWLGLPGSIGAGDIKLYLAAAALLPQRALLSLILLSLGAAGGIGVLRRIRQLRGERGSWQGAWRWLQRAPEPLRQEERALRRIRIGPAVFCAALMYIGGLYG